MPIPKLPKTQARLATSITIRLIPEDTLDTATMADPAQIISSVQNAPIGAVEAFTESNTRNAYPRFEMNAGEPGVVREVYPGLVDMRTIDVARVALYTTDAVEVFNVDGDVVQQSKPFALIKVEQSPEGVNVADRITIFRNCWMTTNPKSYSLQGTDIKIVQDVTIAYSEREVVSVSPTA